MKTLLTPTPLIAIEIPNSYSNFYMDGSLIMSKANSEVIDSFVVGLSPYDKTVILGTVDKGVIDFKTDDLVEKHFIYPSYFKDYECENPTNEDYYKYSIGSFQSLMRANSLSLDKKYLIIKPR